LNSALTLLLLLYWVLINFMLERVFTSATLCYRG